MENKGRSIWQKESWGRFLDLAGDLLFPPRCPGCDGLIPIGQEGFCDKCRPKIEPVTGPVCMKCGKKVSSERISLEELYRWKPGKENTKNQDAVDRNSMDQYAADRNSIDQYAVDRNSMDQYAVDRNSMVPYGADRNSRDRDLSVRNLSGRDQLDRMPMHMSEMNRRNPFSAPPILCDDCKRIPHLYDSGRAVYIYQGTMKQAIYRFKYSNRRQYGRIFAKDAVKNPDLCGWLRMIGRPSVIIPVPMYKKKKRIRGYNQAAVFGRALAELLGCECREDLLTREIDTPALKTLAPKERKQALFRAFQYHGSDVKLNRILLVDDIYTTGTTVDSVSAVLREAGAGRIYVLCICIGKGNYSHA